MNADSLARAIANVRLPAEALPWQIVAILLVGFFVVFALIVRQARAFKQYAGEPPFPTHGATVIVALGLACMTAPVVLSRIALGMGMPDGSGDWLAFLAALAGVTVVGLGVKRFSSPEYQQGKAAAEAIKSAASPPQPTQVVAEQGSVVNTQAQPAATTAKVPAAGVRPIDPAIVAGLAAMAAATAPREFSDIDGEGD